MKRFLSCLFVVAFLFTIHTSSSLAADASFYGLGRNEWGSTAYVGVRDLPAPPPGQEYDYHLEMTKEGVDIDDWQHDFHLVIKDGKCKANEYGGEDQKVFRSLRFTSCPTDPSQTFDVAASIELKPENYFDYPKPKTTGTAVTFTNIEDNYILTLKSTSPAINITNTLTVYADSSQPTLTINPDHIRSGQDVTLESTNCPSGTKVIFKWKEKDGLRTEGSKTVTADSSGLAKHTIKDDKYTDASEDLTFTVTATCEKTGAISVPKTYKVNHHGYETSEITPPHPDPEQNFTITTYGLENDGQCYFVKIQNLETKEWLDPAEDRATLYDESCADGKMDSGKLVGLPGLPGTHRTINHKGQFYAIFESHEDFISFEIPGQLDGAYSYELWTPDKADTFGGANANEDDKHESGWLEFVVGDGQIPEEPKSPPPPCVEGIKYDFSGNGVIGEKTNLNPNIDLCTEYASSIGNIPTEATAFVGKFFAILLSISGGIILLLLIYSGYQIITSQGVPEKIKEARERITSAIVGLLFLVLSLVILQVIGVDLLKIPGLGK